MSDTGNRLGLAARGALAAGFVLLALVTYHGTLPVPLSSDARFLTYQNAFNRDVAGLAHVWTADYFAGAITHGVPYTSGYYRPVVNCLFWLEHRLAGRRDALYNLGQVLLHGLCAFLVFLLCLRIGRDAAAAGVAGLVFALHPVHAFAATEPAARAEVVCFAFYVLALLTFDSALRAPDRRGAARRIALTLILYLGAVLSKEMGITLPAVLALLIVYRHFTDALPLRRLAWTIPAWLAGAAYLVWRFGVLRLAAPEIGYYGFHPAYALALGAIKGMLIQVARLFVPLGAGYPELDPWLANFASDPLSDPLTYAALAVALALVALALAWRKSPLAAFWCAFFLVTFAPLLSVDQIAGSLGHEIILAQERWIYLPSLAVVALAGHGAAHLWRRARRQRGRAPRAALLAGLAALLVFLGGSAALHARRYRDPFARLRHLYLLPEERLGRLERANKLMLYAQWVAVPTGDLEEAEARTREAVRLVPDSPIPAAAHAAVLERSGKWQEAADALEPWLAPSLARLEILHQTNFRVYDDVNRVNPVIPHLLGRAQAHLGNGDRALSLLCEAARRDFDPTQISETVRETYELSARAGQTLPRPASVCPLWKT